MGEYASRIKDWPETERPRERLLHNGPDALSDSELLGIILRTGDQKNTAMDLARHLLHKYGGLRGLDTQPAAVLCTEYGIGMAKAAQIKAALELAKRAVKLEKSPHILDTLAESYYVNGRYEEAIEAGREALAIAKDKLSYYEEQLEKFKR